MISISSIFLELAILGKTRLWAKKIILLRRSALQTSAAVYISSSMFVGQWNLYHLHSSIVYGMTIFNSFFIFWKHTAFNFSWKAEKWYLYVYLKYQNDVLYKSHKMYILMIVIERANAEYILYYISFRVLEKLNTALPSPNRSIIDLESAFIPSL
jgi:hypothetical protein